MVVVVVEGPVVVVEAVVVGAVVGAEVEEAVVEEAVVEAGARVAGDFVDDEGPAPTVGSLVEHPPAVASPSASATRTVPTNLGRDLETDAPCMMPTSVARQGHLACRARVGWGPRTAVTPTQPPSEPQPPPGPHEPGRATDPTEDARLLAAAREGDDAAFAVLIQRHDPLLRLLAHHLLDGRDTDGALTDAYVKAYRGLGRQDGDALPWLTRTTYLACVDRLRRREQRRRGGPGRKPTPQEAPAAEHPLSALPPDQRLVVALIDGCHLSADIAAESLAVPAETVAALLDRGRRTRARPSDGTSEPPSDGVVSDAPDPPADFWPQLGAQLLAERESPAAPVPRLSAPGRSSLAQRRTEPPPLAMQRRAPRRRGFRPEDARPDAVEGLAIEARRRRVRVSRRARTNARLALAVLVVAGSLAGAVFAVVRAASQAKSPVRDNSVADQPTQHCGHGRPRHVRGHRDPHGRPAGPAPRGDVCPDP
ncbi:MAG: hypothetical protein WKF43_07515 [Acidimicrobiales bacterium]